MFGLSEQTRVFLKTGVTDGRLGIDGLRGLVSNVLRQDVLAGYVSPSVTDAATACAVCSGQHDVEKADGFSKRLKRGAAFADAAVGPGKQNANALLL